MSTTYTTSPPSHERRHRARAGYAKVKTAVTSDRAKRVREAATTVVRKAPKYAQYVGVAMDDAIKVLDLAIKLKYGDRVVSTTRPDTTNAQLRRVIFGGDQERMDAVKKLVSGG